MKKFIFYAIVLSPIAAVSALFSYLFFLTNLPQLLYMGSIRNIYFDCLDFVPSYYVYKMKPGTCRLKNIEYDITLTHDADGFRNTVASSYFGVAAIGDSHTHGFGVGDNQTFSFLLGAEHKYATRNLAVPSYATLRELEVLREYGKDSKYVIMQYCDNDAGENEASLRLTEEEFRSQVERDWKTLIAGYDKGKSEGIKKPIRDLGVLVGNGSFSAKSVWRSGVGARNMEREASLFAQILARYRQILDGKRLVIFESSGWGLNSSKFAATFRSELNKLGWPNYKIIDAAKILDAGDYYFLDDHLKPKGHRKLAAAIASEIAQWERSGPVLEKH